MNKKTTKIIIFTFLSLSLIFSLVLPVFAHDSDIASPYSMEQWGMTVAIDFNGNVGIAEGTAIANPDIELLVGELYVYKLVDNKWVRVGSAYDSVTSGRLTISLDFDAESGVTYWAVFTVTETTVEEEIVDSVDVEDTCP